MCGYMESSAMCDVMWLSHIHIRAGGIDLADLAIAGPNF